MIQFSPSLLISPVRGSDTIADTVCRYDLLRHFAVGFGPKKHPIQRPAPTFCSKQTHYPPVPPSPAELSLSR
jgi:hypothetical protein